MGSNSELMAQLAQSLDNYPCYAFVKHPEEVTPKALLRGCWSWMEIASLLSERVANVRLIDESPAGYFLYKLYAATGEMLAEIQIFLSGLGRMNRYWYIQYDQMSQVKMAG
jgi:hypothetical protein